MERTCGVCISRVATAVKADAMIGWTGGVAEGLGTSGLPKLRLPKRDGVRKLDAVPVLGSGKADLKKAKEIAAAEA